MSDNEPLKVDPNPSAKAEAESFENPDERLRATANAHELAVLAAKKGWVGCLTGSANEAMNTGLLILLISLALLGGSMWGTTQYPNTFIGITDNLFKLVLTVAGYVFGTQHSGR
jgi:hypothetical protein